MVSRYRVGCTGWGYDDWREGGFYPPGTPASEYLPRYARVFDLTEVDATYYAPPTLAQTARWAEATPKGFTFTVKLSGDITHKAHLRGADDKLDAFLAAMEPLRRAGKLGPLLVQLPASFTRDRDAAALEAFLGCIPPYHRVAVELRHKSWWTRDTYRALEARGAALVWSVNQYAETPPVATSEFVYARFIGDRAITEFNRVQRDKTEEMRAWVERFEEEGRDAREVYIFLNNHFMGFAPVTARLMQEALRLPPADLSAASRSPGQRALGDFD